MPDTRLMTCAMYRIRSLHRLPAGRSRRSAMAALLLLGASLTAGAQLGPNRFRNVRNAPFAAVSNGPQGAIVVQHAPRRSRETALAVEREVRVSIAQQHSPYALGQAVQALRFLQRNGIKSPRAEIRIPRTIVHTVGGRLILPDHDRAWQTGTPIGDASNNITFQFVGWSQADRAALETYLNEAMPIARSIYGPPAFDIAVQVIEDDELHELQGGTYDVTNNELRLPPLSGNFPEDTFVLIMLVLNAFRDDVALFFDSWEQGMIGAAATAVQIAPGVSPGYDPANPGPFYSGSVYDPMNQPSLGNSTWYPDSGFSGMLVWRIAQARAAWFKCYTEDPNFFVRFNTQYYARLNSLSPAAQTILPGDTPSLLEICATVLPTVEGQSFFNWYRQQYALDTSVSVGPKLYTWNIPLLDAVALIVEHYETTPDGGELPRGGTARLTYYSYEFQSLFAQEGNEIQIPATGDAAGEGFLIPTFFNIGGPQRVTVQIELNGLFAQYPFAYGVRGFDPGENNLYGAIIGPNEGTIEVVGLDGLSGVEVKRGVWGGVISQNAMSQSQLEVTFEDGDGNRVTRTVNVAFDTYDVLLAAGARAGVTKRFSYGSNGLYLMSLPVLPVLGDPATILGIPSEQLMLARWDPAAAGGGRYDFYPAIDPFRPGLGYWLRVLSDVTVAVDGVLPSDRDDVYVPLFAGWNMVGCGRNRQVPMADLLIQRGAADSQPFSDAVTEGWVQAGLWGYDQQSGYKLVSQLEPFDGNWIRCLLPEGATLVFPAFATTSLGNRLGDRPAARSPLAATAWNTQLLLEWGNLRSEAFIGAADSAKDEYDPAYDLQSPPPFGEHPTLRFVQEEWGPDSGEYVSDIRAQTYRGPWRLRVTGVPQDVRARLRWPDLSAMPPDLRPILVDRRTGRRVYMRTTSGYEFTGLRSPREFEVRLEAAAARPLGVMGLLGVQTRQGVAITYTLSADAAVSAQVLNIAGRPVRDLVREKSQASGRSTLLWDLRSASGSLVPSGTYLIALTARADDGQAARAMSKVTVTR